MAIDHHVFALLAALATFMAFRTLLSAGRTLTPRRSAGSTVHVLARSRALPSIELYRPTAPGCPWRATMCREGIRAGNLVLAPGAPLFAYTVLSVHYISGHACTVELAALRPRELINSGRLWEPEVREALALAVA